MNIKKSLILSLCFGLVAAAAPVVGSEPTAFTFQGFLASGGEALTGAVDLEARLYSASTGGSQLGSTQVVSGLAVTGGRLEVVLDFGDVFTGDQVWLELKARPAAGGSFVTLTPRQRLRAAPRVGFAHGAWHADLAQSADSIGGQTPADLLDWSQMTGVPADLTDGDDDTADALGCADGLIARWNGSAWACDADAGVVYRRTLVIGPIGSPAANGAALLAAMASIPTPAGAADARLLKIEPGRYDLGTQTLVMKPWVDVEGSGPPATVITSEVCESSMPTLGVVSGAADSELRGVTIENTCSSPTNYSLAVIAAADGFVVDDLVLEVTGGADFNLGLYTDGSRFRAHRVRTSASGASFVNAGVLVESTGDVELEEVDAEASGGTFAWGIGVILQPGGSASGPGVNVRRCTGRASDATVTVYGLSVENGSDLEMRVVDSRAVAVGGASSALGILAKLSGESEAIRLTGSHFEGDSVGAMLLRSTPSLGTIFLDDVSAVGTSVGLTISGLGGFPVSVTGGSFAGGTASVTDDGGGGVLAHISHARLDGPTSLSSAGSTCTGVSDGTPIFYASTCP